MHEIEEKMFFLQCKYEIAHEALLNLASENLNSFNVLVETALNRIAEVGERERKREAMREPVQDI